MPACHGPCAGKRHCLPRKPCTDTGATTAFHRNPEGARFLQSNFCAYVFMRIYMYICMGNGISPPAFRDISKSQELRHFRVKGLGYMSLGFRVPNFPNSAGPSGLGLFGKLGSMYLYSFLNFPNSAEPDGLRSFGKLGSMYLYSFPNFPNSAEPSGLVSFGKLGNWEDVPGTCTHCPISQFPK